MLFGRDEYELGFLELTHTQPEHLGPRWFALSQLLSPRSLLSFSWCDNNKQAFLAWEQPGSWLWSCSFCFEIYTAVLNLKQYFTASADDSWTVYSTLDCPFMPDLCTVCALLTSCQCLQSGCSKSSRGPVLSLALHTYVGFCLSRTDVGSNALILALDQHIILR